MPLGNAALRLVDREPVVLDGVIVATTGQSRVEFRSAERTYVLSNPSLVEKYAGRPVRISATLHGSDALLDVQAVTALSIQ